MEPVLVRDLGNGVVLMQERGHGVPCPKCHGDGYTSSLAKGYRSGRRYRCRYCEGHGYFWTESVVPKMNGIPLSDRSRHLMTEPVQLLIAERTKTSILAAWEAENVIYSPA